MALGERRVSRTTLGLLSLLIPVPTFMPEPLFLD
jgi:hypothetical protein